MSNFRDLAAEHNEAARRRGAAVIARPPQTPRWTLEAERIFGVPDAADVFSELFADEPYSFWLDSSRVEPGLSRFSFLGDAGGPHGEILCCRPGSDSVLVRAGGTESTVLSSIFDVLDAHVAARAVPSDPALPFDLNGGYVGYFGYELKRDCGAPASHVSSSPDATWMSASRFVAIDHEAGETWALALTDGARGSRAAARAWVDGAAGACRKRRARTRPALQPTREFDPEPWLVRPRARYLADIEECLRLLRAGESYEICLTNTAEIPFDGSPYALYLAQRRLNPAPYAAYLRLGEMHALCSSPERFLKVDRDRVVESKPIKGTAPRAPEPHLDAALREELAASVKTRAENLMIVDLLRNDLGRISDVGTVSVPRFMAVESYETVHQLVSTVRGHLHDGVTAVQAARTCFPGGSMTGAPKLRTMEIIDRLEGRARGPYSGAIGFFGLDGTADLNIVIRTVVAHPGRLSVGAGGAIVLGSDPEAEYEEMLLKARAPLRGLAAPDRGILAGGRLFTGEPAVRSRGPEPVRD